MGTPCLRLARIGAFLAIVSIAVAGCGSGGSTTSSSPVSRPLHTYRVKLTGKAEIPVGAVKGTGYAIIAIHRGSAICWRFAHLHGFVNATVAQIHVGLKDRSGNSFLSLSSGPRLHHRGCAQVKTATLAAIERDPSNYYVNVHSQRYPAGAVRGQL